MMINPFKRIPSRSIFFCSTLMAVVGSASAAPLVYGNMTDGQITIDATYALPRTGTLKDGMVSHALNNPPSSAPISTDFYLYESDASGNNVFFHTYGGTDIGAYFGARASGSGSFNAATSIRYSRIFTNTNATDQVFDFWFNISEGELGLFGSGVGAANLSLRIKRDGTVVAHDTTYLSQDASGLQSCSNSHSGGLGSYINCSKLWASNATYKVNLGLIGAGQSFTVDYDIMTDVSGDFKATTGGGGECQPAPSATPSLMVAIDGCEGPQKGGAFGRSGDPFNYTPADFKVISRNSIPEPGSLALMGLALAGVGALRRRTQLPL